MAFLRKKTARGLDRKPIIFHLHPLSHSVPKNRMFFLFTGTYYELFKNLSLSFSAIKIRGDLPNFVVVNL